MIIETEVGPQTSRKSLADTSQIPFRSGNMGDTIVSELHGRYYEAAYRASLFSGANSAGVTTTVGTATTYIGLCLSNPLLSGYNLVLTKVGYSFPVVFTAAAALGLMVGFSATANVTHTTPISPRSNLIGAPVGVGLLDSSATLPVTPAVALLFGAAIASAAPTNTPGLLDLEGSIILPPGGFAAFYTSTASGTSGFLGSLFWEEVPT